MKSQYFFTLAIIIFAFAFTSCSGKSISTQQPTPPTPEVIPFVGEYNVYRYKLENGLKLLVIKDTSSPTIAYQTWFRVGSKDEAPRKTGLAHLFEHMMFKETQNLKDGEFDRILESAGGEGINAFTNHDYTAYIQEVPKEKLDLIAKLESERMSKLIVNEQAFKTETEVVQNERRLREENNPDGTMFNALFALAFTKHPYKHPVIGLKEDLENMRATDASQFYRSYYNPNHATIVVVGDTEPKNVLETIQKHYALLESHPSPENIPEVEPDQKKMRERKMRLNIQVEKIMMAYHIPEVTHADIPALWVLRRSLAGGKSSRLSKALVESGLSTSADAFAIDGKDPSLFIIIANMQKGKAATKAQSTILSEIKTLITSPLSDKELERVKNQLQYELYSGLNTSYEKARFLGEYETTTDGFERVTQVIARLQSVSATDVQAVARKYFAPNKSNIIIGVSK